jgi:hypothetical protein
MDSTVKSDDLTVNNPQVIWYLKIRFGNGHKSYVAVGNFEVVIDGFDLRETI